MNWDHIRYLISVADCGSVSRASQALGVSHATVLRAISRLEKDLETRLFNHFRTGYRLTGDGEAVLAKARIMAEQVGLIEREQKGRDAVPAGILRLAIPDPSIYNLMNLLHRFRKNYNQINLQIVRGEIIEPDMMLDKQVDVVIGITNEPPEELVGRQIKKLRFLPILHRDTLSNDESSAGYDWVLWSTQGAGLGSNNSTNHSSNLETGAEMQQTMMRRIVNSQVVMTTSTHGDALEAVQAGAGIACLSEEVLHRHRDRLVALPRKGTAQTMGLWILTHPDLRTSARVTALLRLFADQAE